jgi:hypothetical protein
MQTISSIKDLYSFPGFRAQAHVQAHETDPQGYVVTLVRRQKKRCVRSAAPPYPGFEHDALIKFAISMLAQSISTWRSNIGACTAHGVRA